MLKWYYRLFLFLLGVLGLIIQIAKSGWGMLLYYTILSNLMIVAFLGYLLYKKYQHQEADLERDTFLRIKGGASLAILITFVIYHFMLSPFVTNAAYWNLENFIVHYFIPLGFVFDTLLLDRKRLYRWTDPFIWLLPQFAYTAIAFFNGFVTKWTIPGAPDSPFAYYFLNIPKYGWRFVGLNSLVIMAAYVLVGYAFTGLKHVLGPKD